LTTISAPYYSREEAPFQWALADAFTICDGCHCSIATGTDPNRKLLHGYFGFSNDGNPRPLQIKDVPEGESKAILDFLYEHCGRAHWQVRFRWQPDSVAFWDNRCVQHIAMWDYFPQVRSGYRVTVKGDKPFHRAH